MTDYNSDSDHIEPQPVEPIEKPKKKFSDAINNILNEPTASRPVLSKKRQLEKQVDKDKSLLKQQKLARVEKRKQTSHLLPSVNNNELTLKKLATKGVVQLFNAIKSAQKIVKEDEPEITKQVFLENIKQNSLIAKEELTSIKAFE